MSKMAGANNGKKKDRGSERSDRFRVRYGNRRSIGGQRFEPSELYVSADIETKDTTTMTTERARGKTTKEHLVETGSGFIARVVNIFKMKCDARVDGYDERGFEAMDVWTEVQRIEVISSGNVMSYLEGTHTKEYVRRSPRKHSGSNFVSGTHSLLEDDDDDDDE